MAMRAMTLLEAPEESEPTCSTTGCTSLGQYWCSDCDTGLHFCKQCTLERHQSLPFHVLECWNGRFYQRTCLQDLGFIWHLPFKLHKNSCCPHWHTGCGIQELTILDVNGIHKVNTAFCRCQDVPEPAEQLFLQRIFPASTIRPRTGFTFRVLRLFHMLNITARTTPWDFTGAMYRLTDGIDTEGIPVSLTSSEFNINIHLLDLACL